MKIQHLSLIGMREDNKATQCNWSYGLIQDIMFCYNAEPEDLTNVVSVSRIYPKGQNPRRHPRDLLPENQRI